MEENNAFQEKNTRKQASLFSFFGGGKKTAQPKQLGTKETSNNEDKEKEEREKQEKERKEKERKEKERKEKERKEKEKKEKERKEREKKDQQLQKEKENEQEKEEEKEETGGRLQGRRRLRRAASKAVSYQEEEEEEDEEGEKENKEKNRKRKRDGGGGGGKKKRKTGKKRGSDDDDDDFVMGDQEDDDDDEEFDEGEEEEEEDDLMSEYKASPRSSRSTPKKTPAKRALQRSKSTGSLSSSSSLPSSPLIRSTGEAPPDPTLDWNPKERFPWISDEKIRDAAQRRPDDPLYNPGTLYIPPGEYRKLGGFAQQWWDAKRNHYDCIVFFRKGYFYELFNQDADIGRKVLNLKVTARGEMKLAGVPQTQLEPWAARLVQNGYKVAIVEELETAIRMEKRKTQGSASPMKDKKSSIIQREVVKVLTAGTVCDEAMMRDPSSASYLLSIYEDPETREMGVCLVDASVGTYDLAQFQNDQNYSEFETLLLQMMPREVLYIPSTVSKKALKTIQTTLQNVQTSHLQQENAWPPPKTLSFLNSSFPSSSPSSPPPSPSSSSSSPSSPTNLSLSKLEDLSETKDLLWTAFGNCLSYLESLKMGSISLGNIRMYDPLGGGEGGGGGRGGRMILDGQSLGNLNVLGAEDGTGIVDGQTSLLNFLDRTLTSYGKRKLRRWLCHPLQRIDEIKERQKAVQHLLSDTHLSSILTSFLKKRKVDVERKLAKIHYSSSLFDFVTTLRELKEINEFMIKICENDLTDTNTTLITSLCRRSTTTATTARFPNITKLLKKFEDLFDWEEALETKIIQPRDGQDPKYDKLSQNVKKIEKELEDIRKKEERSIGVGIKYIHQHKLMYQFEIPISSLPDRKTPNHYLALSKTAKVKRFHTPEIQNKIVHLAEARDELEHHRTSVLGEYQSSFGEDYPLWKKAVDCVGELDVLLSLACVSSSGSKTMSVPQFLPPSHPPHLQIEEMYHPCMVDRVVTDFVSNDVTLGEKIDPTSFPPPSPSSPSSSPSPSQAKFMLLSGPNMGGKSTLLRQVCVTVILAQLGCHVPASSCILTPVDRIFTRVGASDNMAAGRSTFLVELMETSSILNHASPNSLVILDELGRGTSTFDGYSVAFATTDYLSRVVGCRGLFATHYFNLSKEFESRPEVTLSHMSYYSDQQNQQQQDEEDVDDVTFLYKMEPGSDPNSFGRVVAKMAGVPAPILERAREVARTHQGKFLLQSDLEHQKKLQTKHMLEEGRLVYSSLGNTSCELKDLIKRAKKFV